jgi:hypothetical protein
MSDMPSHQRDIHKVANTPGRHPNNNGQRRNSNGGNGQSKSSGQKKRWFGNRQAKRA